MVLTLTEPSPGRPLKRAPQPGMSSVMLLVIHKTISICTNLLCQSKGIIPMLCTLQYLATHRKYSKHHLLSKSHWTCPNQSKITYLLVVVDQISATWTATSVVSL